MLEICFCTFWTSRWNLGLWTASFAALFFAWWGGNWGQFTNHRLSPLGDRWIFCIAQYGSSKLCVVLFSWNSPMVVMCSDVVSTTFFCICHSKHKKMKLYLSGVATSPGWSLGIFASWVSWDLVSFVFIKMEDFYPLKMGMPFGEG